MCDTFTLNQKISDILWPSVSQLDVNVIQTMVDKLFVMFDDHYTAKIKDMIQNLEKVHQVKITELQSKLKKQEDDFQQEKNKLKQLYETEIQLIQNSYEDFVLDIKGKAELEAMKKYDGVKYEKLKLDVDFSPQMGELKAIKFNNL